MSTEEQTEFAEMEMLVKMVHAAIITVADNQDEKDKVFQEICKEYGTIITDFSTGLRYHPDGTIDKAEPGFPRRTTEE